MLQPGPSVDSDGTRLGSNTDSNRGRLGLMYEVSVRLLACALGKMLVSARGMFLFFVVAWGSCMTFMDGVLA